DGIRDFHVTGVQTCALPISDLELDGVTRKVLMQAPKAGFFYIPDRATGELLSADPYVPVNWATHVDLETGRPAMDEAAVDYRDEIGRASCREWVRRGVDGVA